jgi:hypothetical protein
MLMLTDCWEVCREVVFFVFVCDAGLGFAFEVWAVWFSGVCAGIRVTVFAVQASPLCGAAPTFLCRRKEK